MRPLTSSAFFNIKADYLSFPFKCFRAARDVSSMLVGVLVIQSSSSDFHGSQFVVSYSGQKLSPSTPAEASHDPHHRDHAQRQQHDIRKLSGRFIDKHLAKHRRTP